jgi:PrtD family type I secretion system ABC transporter
MFALLIGLRVLCICEMWQRYGKHVSRAQIGAGSPKTGPERQAIAGKTGSARTASHCGFVQIFPSLPRKRPNGAATLPHPGARRPAMVPIRKQTVADPAGAALAALRPGLWAALGISAAIGLLMLTGSVYMLQVYDRVLGSGSGATLLALFAIVILLYGFLAVYDALRMRLLSRLALRLERDLAGAAFRSGLARDGDGQAVADIATLRAALAGPAMLALFDLPFTLLFLAVLFVIHPLLGWLTLGGMGLAAGLAAVNHRVLARPLAAATVAEAETRRFAEKSRRAAPAVTALGMAGAVTARWTALLTRAQGAQQAGAEPSETLAALSRSLRMLLQSALLTAGAWLAILGAISAGAIVAASILSGRALAPVDQLIGQWRSVGQARAALARLREGLRPAAAPAMDLPAPNGALEVRGLVKLAPERADGAERARLLDGVAFSLAAGDGLGVVGPSASGKSTLARLIVGAAAPDAGEIRLDGATRDQWHPDALGRHVGYLPQQVDLLPGTLRDNIARFDPAATDAAVIAAAEAAGVHRMILRLPRGYDTEVGGAETPLSGGQLQRIGLARALYGEPRLIVLDEPNAHLDQAGEAALTEALHARRAAGATVIVMAHRIGALAAVDRLIVLEDGHITEDGPRDEVLRARLGGTPLRVASVTVTPGRAALGAPPAAPAALPAPEPGAAAGRRPPEFVPLFRRQTRGHQP